MYTSVGVGVSAGSNIRFMGPEKCHGACIRSFEVHSNHGIIVFGDCGTNVQAKRTTHNGNVFARLPNEEHVVIPKLNLQHLRACWEGTDMYSSTVGNQQGTQARTNPQMLR